MASRKDNLKGLIQNSRTRVIIIITALILIFTMFYGYVHFSSSEAVPKQSKLRLAPNIDSIPGALNQTAEYTSLQNKQNSEQAKKALESGSSAIPTIINVQKFGEGVNEIGPQGGRGGLGFSSLAKLNNGSIKPLWAEDLENSNCNIKSLKSAIENGANNETLKEYCSCQQLKDYGFKINDLNSVCDCGELRLMGFSALQLKNIGFNAGKLRECGYSACEEKAAGFSASDMKKGGFPDAELKGAGFSNSDLAQASGLPFGISAQEVLKKGCGLDAINELKAKGVSASAIRHISGCSIDQLKKAGFSANDLKDAGFTAADLLNAGYSPISLNKAGFSAKDLSDAGVSPEELAAAGFSAKDIKRELSGRPTNITPEDIKQNGCSVDALKQERQLGISAKNLSRLTKCSAEALLKAGYTPDELAAAGYANTGLPLNVTADDIREAGCAPEKIAKLRKAGVKAETIMAISKCPLEALKAAGFTAADLLRAGASPELLANAGFSPDDIKKGQAQSSQAINAIREAGCAPEKMAQLRKAGVKAETIMAISKCPLEALKAAGFTAADLLRAGASPEQLANAKFSPDEIKDGQAESSIRPEDIRKAGCAPEKIAQLRKTGVKAEAIMMLSKCPLDALKAAGFTAADLLQAGGSPEKLANAGFSPDEIVAAQDQVDKDLSAAIKAAGCDPVKLAKLQKKGVSALAIVKANGCDPLRLKQAGFTARDLLKAGSTPEQLTAAGFSPKDIQDAQNSAINALTGAKSQTCTPAVAAKAKAQGMTATELRKTLGCSLAALKAAGFNAKELTEAGFTPGELAQAGYTLPELLAAGFTPTDLKAAGFSPEELVAAGVSPKELLGDGFSPAELLKAGVSPKDLLAAGVSAEDLKAAGLGADELQKAGVSDAILEKLGINPKMAALADIADINLKKNDAPTVSSMLQGGNQSPTIKQNTEQLDKLVVEQKKAQAQQKFQQKIQTQASGMQSFAQQLLTAWKTTGTQTYVAGRVKTPVKDATASTTGSGSVAAIKGEAEVTPESMNSNNAPTVKTGDILFAVVDTAVNTDEPGPLLATITNGPLKGAKLIGSFSAGSSQAEKLTISFNSLSVPWLIKTIGISAYAIDPNTGRTALSSSTNHHYLERYGALFASTFLEGFGNAFQSADTTITVGGTGGETNTTVQNGINRSLTDNAVIGLATLGKAWGQQAARNMNKPTTIQIYSGTPVGVLFLQDVNIPEK